GAAACRRKRTDRDSAPPRLPAGGIPRSRQVRDQHSGESPMVSAARKTPADAIADLVRSGTKRWADQRKAEERHPRARANRDNRLVHFKVRKVTIKDVAYKVMRRAYMDASSNGTLPANARQIYYAARGEILERTGKDNLDSQYFCQDLLVRYV